MGHLSPAGRASLLPLVERLNRMPMGLPPTDDLYQILELLFTSQEAAVVARLPVEEVTLAEASRRCGLPASELEPILESLASKGLVMDLKIDGRAYYLALPGLIGFFEISLMRGTESEPLVRLARLMTAYHGHDRGPMDIEFFGHPTQLSRAVAYENRFPGGSTEIAPYKRASRIILDASYRAVTSCYCRHKKQLLGHQCEKGAPLEICMSLGLPAEYLVRRGFARQISLQEGQALLDRAEELGLVHVVDNVRKAPAFLCNCCGCCCGLLSGYHQGFPRAVAPSNFVAHLDQERCTGCAKCLRRCNIGAIGLRFGREGNGKRRPKYFVLKERCLGCGVCTAGCEAGALVLQIRPGGTPPPKSWQSKYLRIAWERGKLWPLVRGRVSRLLRGDWHRSPLGK